jgi:hypothetical protein
MLNSHSKTPWMQRFICAPARMDALIRGVRDGKIVPLDKGKSIKK